MTSEVLFEVTYHNIFLGVIIIFCIFFGRLFLKDFVKKARFYICVYIRNIVEDVLDETLDDRWGRDVKEKTI